MSTWSRNPYFYSTLYSRAGICSLLSSSNLTALAFNHSVNFLYCSPGICQSFSPLTASHAMRISSLLKGSAFLAVIWCCPCSNDISHQLDYITELIICEFYRSKPLPSDFVKLDIIFLTIRRCKGVVNLRE